MSSLIKISSINDKIFTVRGVAVMLDRDLALFYNTETRTLKQAVRRNIERFPSDFMFVLTNADIDFLVSQSVIPSRKYVGGAKPFAFTEQGVSMLSSVIKTTIAVQVSIQIIRAFLKFKKFLSENASVFERLSTLETKQLYTDQKIEKLFNALEQTHIKPKQGVFFDGQVFDAYSFVSQLIKQASKSIILIDNYVDESVLVLLGKKQAGVACTLFTKTVSEQLKLDVAKFNKQYPTLKAIEFGKAHDRFLIIDETEVYHVGASLKDLGQKWFAFTRLEQGSVTILQTIKDLL